MFNTKKLNVNASNSTRNLAVAIGEAATGRSYDLTSNPTGSFRAFNLDPQVKILSGAPTISQPLYGANLKVELNGTTGTNKTGGVFAINAYSLISGTGHTVDKNVGASILADVGNNLAGTTVSNNFSLEINGVASRTGTVITNSRSVVINCPNHGSSRRGLLIGAEQTTGLPVGTNNRSLEVIGTSQFIGSVRFAAPSFFSDFIQCTSTVDGNTGQFNQGILGTLKLGALSFSTAPATATSTGSIGDIRCDDNYIYLCTATNTWKRAALSTW